MIRRCALTVVLSALAAGVAVATPADVTVFVTAIHSSETHPTDEDRGLDDAARELRDALRHKGWLRIVETADDPDIRVEVTNREEHDTGEGGFGGIKVTKFSEMTIRFRAKARDGATVEMKGIGQGSWGRAAKEGANTLVKWIDRHRP